MNEPNAGVPSTQSPGPVPGAEDLSKTTPQGNEEMIEIPGEEGKDPIRVPKQEVYNAYLKKSTNADKVVTKKTTELAQQRKALEAKEAKLDEALQKLDKFTPKEVPSKPGVEGLDIDLEDYSKEDVDRAVKLVEGIIDKKITPIKEGQESIKKKVDGYDSAKVADQVNVKTKEIVDASGLDDYSKGLFVSSFIGNHDVDNMSLEDSLDENTGAEVPGLYTLMGKELKEFEKTMKERGLVVNKEYVDKKTGQHQELGTDNKGAGGRDTADVALKDVKGRARVRAKEALLRGIAEKHLTPRR